MMEYKTCGMGGGLVASRLKIGYDDGLAMGLIRFFAVQSKTMVLSFSVIKW